MRDLDDVTSQYGRWTAHSLRLPDGRYTIESGYENHLLYVRRILQLTADLLSKPLEQARVLDLACLEGGFSVEFALHGASVVAVEGRQQNLAKLELVRDALELSKLQTVLDDVRNVTRERFGTFDVALCLGLLYHLDGASLAPFLRNLLELTTRLVVIDTHVSLFGGEQLEIGGRQYAGASQPEHGLADDAATVAGRNWASLDNRTSFYLTEPSLLNLLADIGFSSVYTCHVPYYGIMTDRRTYVALKGSPRELRCDDRGAGLAARNEEAPEWRVVEPVNRRR